jgi:hypothetical protein
MISTGTRTVCSHVSCCAIQAVDIMAAFFCDKKQMMKRIAGAASRQNAEV